MLLAEFIWAEILAECFHWLNVFIGWTFSCEADESSLQMRCKFSRSEKFYVCLIVISGTQQWFERLTDPQNVFFQIIQLLSVVRFFLVQAQ